MPWKETSVMKLRREFVLRALEPGRNMSALCREYGISREKGYKWLERFEEEGVAGLQDRSRRPRTHPLAISVAAALDIVRLRLIHPHWGPKKLRALLIRAQESGEVPSASTIGRVLAFTHLSEGKGRGRPRRVWPQESTSLTVTAPNDLWTMDFKGWWRMGNGRRCEPFTCRDAFSRYILMLRPVRSLRHDVVRELCEELFERYGQPQEIRSDNGSPFASTSSPYGLTRLSAWWRLLSIHSQRIEPGHPEQNGSHERMHGDLAREVEIFPHDNAEQERARLEQWRVEYNETRPHEALGMKTPSQLFRVSSRRYRGPNPLWPYPSSFDQRKVSHNGVIYIAKRPIFLTEALQGLQVGLERTGLDTVRVWFCDLCLGDLDIRSGTPLRPPASALSQNESNNLSPMF
jgi:transposase InsO family protein